MNFNYLNHFVEGELRNFLKWNDQFGPVTYSILKKTSPPEPEWWIGSAKLGNCPIGLFYTNNISASAGTSIYPEEAMLRTVGETIERYSSMNSHLIDKFEPRIIDETLGFVRCADFENSEPTFKKNGIPKPVEHTLVEKLIDGTHVYMPYEYVHLGFTRFDAKIMHTTSISTGCSFYYDTITAIWKSICEVVERDAMMRLWYPRLKACRVRFNGLVDEGLSIRCKRIKDAGLKLHVFEISSVIDIPVFGCI
jgi:ribosomal protein S12 methylthiotransferase accessory factor YcaO